MNARTLPPRTPRLSVFVFLCCVLASCGERNTAQCLRKTARAPEPMEISWTRSTDENQLTVTSGNTTTSVPLAPARIVSALPGITEMVAYLGGRKQLIAVTPHCDTPAGVADLPKISVHPLSTEQLRALRPDLILVDARLHRRDLEPLHALAREGGARILALHTSRTLHDLDRAFALLAAVLDTPRAHAQATSWSRRRLELVTTLNARASSTPIRMMAVAQWEPLYVMHPGSLIDDMMRLVGGVNIACDAAASASGTFSEELVLNRRPAIILAAQMPMPEALQGRWSRVPAMAHASILDISGDTYARAGPRTLDALASLASRMANAMQMHTRDAK